MVERAQDELKKSEIKWWWPVIILVASLAAMWGSLRYETTTLSTRVAEIEQEQKESADDRLLLESRLTRIETKIDNLIEIMANK